MKTTNVYLAIALSFLLVLSNLIPCAQELEWTWMKGSNGSNLLGTYGTLGVSGISNNPGSRDNSVTWIDSLGTMWLFGGRGYAAGGTLGFLNDLWKYDTASNQWIWVKGPNITNQQGIYGTQGVAASSNLPGARAGAISWVDQSGMFWLFGGNGYSSISSPGVLNDLWKYNPATNMWTWLSGSTSINQYGIYGTQGIGSVSNRPGAREESSSWIDTAGNLWLGFGSGYASTSGVAGRLNDLWKYEIGTGKWTWVKGSDNIAQIGVYGALGVAASTNVPGSRERSNCWKDIDGNFWILGGLGLSAGLGLGTLNDLWKYDVSANNWTWIKGDSIVGQYGIYIAQGLTNSLSMPGARYNGCTWTDEFNNLWLFGGYGFPSSCCQGTLSDLWVYEPSINCWTWVKGSQFNFQYGTNGTQGVSSPTNNPGARQAAAGWIDADNSLWLFGGTGFTDTASGRNNELWRFVTKICSLSVVLDSVHPISCHGDTDGALIVSASNAIGVASYEWNTTQSTSMITALSPGTYTVTVTDTNGCHDTQTFSVVEPELLEVMADSTITTLCNGNSDGYAFAFVSGGTPGYTYLWSNNQTDTNAHSLPAGTYYVTVTDAHGCEAVDTAIVSQPDAININTLTITHVTNCYGDGNGEINLKVTGGTPGYNYYWSESSLSGDSLSNLSGGYYTVTVYDGNNCMKSKEFYIQSNRINGFVFGSEHTTCVGGDDGSMAITVSGGAQPITYLWSNGATTQGILGLTEGTYTVTATDANGCTIGNTSTIGNLGNQPPVPHLGNDTVVESGASITLNPGEFDNYLWSDQSDDETLDVSATGTYWVEVEDELGCRGSDTIHIEIWPVGISELNRIACTIYPNPATDFIRIDFNTEIESRITIYDSEGRALVHQQPNSAESKFIDLSQLNYGIYYIQVSTEFDTNTYPIVKR